MQFACSTYSIRKCVSRISRVRHSFMPVLENRTHQLRRMSFRRLRPVEPFFVNGTVLCDLNQFAIDQQTVVSMHKREVARVVCADNRLASKHRFAKTETEAFCVMQRDEAVAHL